MKILRRLRLLSQIEIKIVTPISDGGNGSPRPARIQWNQRNTTCCWAPIDGRSGPQPPPEPPRLPQEGRDDGYGRQMWLGNVVGAIDAHSKEKIRLRDVRTWVAA